MKFEDLTEKQQKVMRSAVFLCALADGSVITGTLLGRAQDLSESFQSQFPGVDPDDLEELMLETSRARALELIEEMEELCKS